MSTKVTVNWLPGQAYKHRLTARQHEFFTDAPQASKGGDQAASPHEIFLLGLGGCVAMTVEMYAQRKGWDITAVKVTITEDSVDDPDAPGSKIPRIVEDLEIEGKLSADQLDKLKTIAKSCPVYKLFVGKKQVDCVLSHKNPAPVDPNAGQPSASSTTCGGT